MRKLCGMSLLILALLFPFPVFAAGQEKVMGMVQFQCMVDLSLDGQTMELVFEEQDTGEEVTVSSREYKSHAITARCRLGLTGCLLSGLTTTCILTTVIRAPRRHFR